MLLNGKISIVGYNDVNRVQSYKKKSIYANLFHFFLSFPCPFRGFLLVRTGPSRDHVPRKSRESPDDDLIEANYGVFSKGYETGNETVFKIRNVYIISQL